MRRTEQQECLLTNSVQFNLIQFLVGNVLRRDERAGETFALLSLRCCVVIGFEFDTLSNSECNSTVLDGSSSTSTSTT